MYRQSLEYRQWSTANKSVMGEGSTPLIRLLQLEKKLEWAGEIWAKCEFQNPTGSFKDRGSVSEIQIALSHNKQGVVCASTGNMAASLSAYAARAGLKCYVVVPTITPETKLRQATIAGAELVKINGNYDECVGEAIALAAKKNLLLCGDYEVRREGQRSIGIELACSGINFSAFICPIGNGTVGCATAEGFAKKNQRPQFIGVQGFGADPLTAAWKNNKPICAIRKPKTIASAMNVGCPLDGKLTLDLVRASDGALVSVTDKEITAAQQFLARIEGIFVESAAAATVAALPKIPQPNQCAKIVLILTGSGLKENV